MDSKPWPERVSQRASLVMRPGQVQELMTWSATLPLRSNTCQKPRPACTTSATIHLPPGDTLRPLIPVPGRRRGCCRAPCRRWTVTLTWKTESAPVVGGADEQRVAAGPEHRGGRAQEARRAAKRRDEVRAVATLQVPTKIRLRRSGLHSSPYAGGGAVEDAVRGGAAHVLDVHGVGAARVAAVVGDVGELLAVGADGGDVDVAGEGELGAVAEGEGRRAPARRGLALAWRTRRATAPTSDRGGEADAAGRASTSPVRRRRRCGRDRHGAGDRLELERAGEVAGAGEAIGRRLVERLRHGGVDVVGHRVAHHAEVHRAARS